MNCSDNYGDGWDNLTGAKQEAMAEAFYFSGGPYLKWDGVEFRPVPQADGDSTE